MHVNIVAIDPKILVGKRLQMSLSKDRTPMLWQNFMPYRNSIKHRTSSALISLQDYKNPFCLQDFTTTTEFDKWAAVEVSKVQDLPENMETYTISGGLYAVFTYVGTPQGFRNFLSDIYNEWFPSADYILDHRPHFEILGDKYRNNHPDSEEEVWIPVKKKIKTSFTDL
ncbi:GyrI-like domain-containing protein [Sediminicola sp. 1XM1-17]|uniref:GyrI-like domain-containing protein n=1 Tax=Sediminicola sp. 1XM1-17 TaxID=3127702 RepID=UPI0030789E56